MTKGNASDTFEGWVSAGFLFLPGIPLWFFWDELLRWSGGYGEIVAGVVIFLQATSLLLLKPLLMRRTQDLYRWLDARRKKQRPNNLDEKNPALAGLQDSLRSMPVARVRELAAIAANLARQDREQNVRVATAQCQTAKPKESTHSKEVNTILRRMDATDKVPTQVGMSMVQRVLAKRKSDSS